MIFGSFLEEVDGSAVRDLFVKAGSLFSILDGVIIECDSTGV
jgi:hypothetical protein